MSDLDEVLARHKRLFDRPNQESLWQTLAELFYPERADFTVTRTPGVEVSDHLFDSTPPMLRRDLANSFSAMMRPRDQEWMRASVANEEELRDKVRGRQFFDHVTRRVRTALYDGRSQFVQATKQADHDYATFGAAVLSCEPGDRPGALRYRAYHLKKCAWDDDHNGQTDTMFREFELSARNMRKMFRREGDSLHEKVQDALEGRGGSKGPDTKFKLLHVSMPRDDYPWRGRAPTPRDAPWASCYIDLDNQHVIREAVTYEFRYLVPRWQRMQGTVYPVSPAAMSALPDARMLQAMARVMLEAAEKQVDPPLKATREAVIGEINFAPSGVTWVDRMYDERFGPAIEPFDLGKNVRLGVDMLERVTAQLTEAWYISKLNLPERGERTAYEMARRVEEYIRAAVPLFEPLETEYQVPLLDLSMAILMRQRAFNMQLLPEELMGEDIVWQFANPLHDALERNKVFAAEGNMNLLLLAKQHDPNVTMDFDVRTAYREAALATGPSHWVVPQDIADQRVADALEQQQAAQAAQQIGAMGEAATRAGEGAAAAAEGAANMGALAELMR